jgi:hypothetical protein
MYRNDMKYICLIAVMLLLTRINAYICINILGTGLYLPYSLGVVGYIKKHIEINDSIKLSGVSGGSWCSLLYALENDLSNHDEIWNYTMGDDNFKLRLTSNMHEFHHRIEKNLKLRYKDVKTIPDISILATRYDNQRMKLFNEKISSFQSINDLINYCACSSYIPYISGTLMCKEYDNKYYMDGDILRNPELYNCQKNFINIHRHIWGRKFKLNNLIYSDKNVSKELFTQGWNDTEKNKDFILNLLKK